MPPTSTEWSLASSGAHHPRGSRQPRRATPAAPPTTRRTSRTGYSRRSASHAPNGPAGVAQCLARHAALRPAGIAAIECREDQHQIHDGYTPTSNSQDSRTRRAMRGDSAVLAEVVRRTLFWDVFFGNITRRIHRLTLGRVYMRPVNHPPQPRNPARADGPTPGRSAYRCEPSAGPPRVTDQARTPCPPNTPASSFSDRDLPATPPQYTPRVPTSNPSSSPGSRRAAS